MDAPRDSGPTLSGLVASHLSREATTPDPEAWNPDSALAEGEPTAGELARRLGETDVIVLRPDELVRFSLAAGQLAEWADGLRRAAEARLVVLLGSPRAR